MMDKSAAMEGEEQRQGLTYKVAAMQQYRKKLYKTIKKSSVPNTGRDRQPHRKRKSKKTGSGKG